MAAYRLNNGHMTLNPDFKIFLRTRISESILRNLGTKMIELSGIFSMPVKIYLQQSMLICLQEGVT
jgi:hypothetical protein